MEGDGCKGMGKCTGCRQRKLRKLKRVRAEARGQQGREGKKERERERNTWTGRDTERVRQGDRYNGR